MPLATAIQNLIDFVPETWTLDVGQVLLSYALTLTYVVLRLLQRRGTRSMLSGDTRVPPAGINCTPAAILLVRRALLLEPQTEIAVVIR